MLMPLTAQGSFPPENEALLLLVLVYLLSLDLPLQHNWACSESQIMFLPFTDLELRRGLVLCFTE